MDFLLTSFNFLTNKWVLIPSLIFFQFNQVIILFITGAYFTIYKAIYRAELKKCEKDDQALEKYWDKPLRQISKFIYFFMKLYHGYEMEGIENIQEGKPALLIMYHSAASSDILYNAVYIYLKLNRKPRVVADRCLFKVPILKNLYRGTQSTPGQVDEIVELLNQNHIVIILPGGLYESAFSDENYNLIWGNRKGFARAAIKAKAPIIPMFTQNCREMMKILDFGRDWWHGLYEKTRACLRFWVGQYPVKLRGIIGKPIEHDDNRTVDELADLTKQKLEELIKSRQRLPGSIKSALIERLIS